MLSTIQEGVAKKRKTVLIGGNKIKVYNKYRTVFILVYFDRVVFADKAEEVLYLYPIGPSRILEIWKKVFPRYETLAKTIQYNYLGYRTYAMKASHVENTLLKNSNFYES